MGIFDDTDLYQRYAARLRFRDKVLGGLPKNPRALEGWIEKGIADSKGKGTAREMEYALLHDRMLEHLERLDVPVGPEMTVEEMAEVAKEYANSQHTNGFREIPGLGLCLEGRQVKALLKESCNSLFAGEKWGVTRKGPKNFLAERVFVEELVIPLGRVEPDGLELIIGHVNGPRGPQSTLTYHEYIERAEIEFTVMSVNDCITAEQWKQMLVHGQMLGLGAARSQGHGTFSVEAFDKLSAAEARRRRQGGTFALPVAIEAELVAAVD